MLVTTYWFEFMIYEWVTTDTVKNTALENSHIYAQKLHVFIAALFGRGKTRNSLHVYQQENR